MHIEVLDWLAHVVPLLARQKYVLEFGSCDVNGSARQFFLGAHYIGIDVRPGPGVDTVADAADFSPKPWFLFDVVISTEMLEHCRRAAEVCANAARLLKPGGVFLASMAGPSREPHSVDAGPLAVDEYYRNVTEADLYEWLILYFPVVMIQNRLDIDLYVLAIK